MYSHAAKIWRCLLAAILVLAARAKESVVVRVACLGVTAADWRRLAAAAAGALDLDTARAAYMKVHDLRQIELLNSMEVRRALLSVSDKTDLEDLGRFLASKGVEILSTGGTAKRLRSAGLEVVDVHRRQQRG